MPFLVGPVVALLGVFSVFVVLRTRARARQSLYASRRAELGHRAMDRRRRALAAAAERDTSGPLGQSWDASALSAEPQRAVAAAAAAPFEISQRVEPGDALEQLDADSPGATTPELGAPDGASQAASPPPEEPSPELPVDLEPPSQTAEEAPDDAQATLWTISPFAVRPAAPTATPAPPSSPSATIPAALNPAPPEATTTGESVPTAPPPAPQPTIAPPASPPFVPAPPSSTPAPPASTPTPVEATAVPPSIPPFPSSTQVQADESVPAGQPATDEQSDEPLTDLPTPPLPRPAGSWAVVDHATGLQTVMLPGESYLPQVDWPLAVSVSMERADEELKEGLVQSVAGYAGLVVALVATLLGIVLMFANGHG